MSEATEAALIAPEDIAPLAEAWDALSACAIESNVFLARWFVAARLRHLPDRAGAAALAAWRGEGAARRLVGLLVLVRPRGVRFNPLPILRAAELYAPLSTPLLDPERPGETWSAMLDAASRAGITGLALPFLAEEGEVADVLRRVASSHGAPFVALERHRRAVLVSPLGGEAYLRETLEKRRRKEAERQRRRLAEAGDLRFLDVSASDDPAALERFLALEAAGWKGRAGTDLAHAEGAAGFWRDAASASAGALRVVSLERGGRPVASGLVARAGSRAFYVKTAYDEAHARLSPGFLLTLDLTAALLDDPAVAGADSVAVADHPMIDRLWTGRLAIVSVLVATRRSGGIAFRLALAAERMRIKGRNAAKRTIARVARWRAQS